MTRHEERHDETLNPQDVRDTIAANIRTAQAEAGIDTVEELAHRAGISLRLVQKHRAGDNAPGHANLLRYSRALNKPWTWFLERHGEELAA